MKLYSTNALFPRPMAGKICKNCGLVVKSSWSQAIRKGIEGLKKEGSNNQAPETINLIYAMFISKKIYVKEGGKNPARLNGLVANFGPQVRHSHSKFQGNTRWTYPWFPRFQAQKPDFTHNFNFLGTTKHPPETSDLSSAFLVSYAVIRSKCFLWSLSSKAFWFPVAVPPLSHFSRLDLTP